MKKIKVLALLAATAMFMSCVSTGGSDNDPAVNKGVNAWNAERGVLRGRKASCVGACSSRGHGTYAKAP